MTTADPAILIFVRGFVTYPASVSQWSIEATKSEMKNMIELTEATFDTEVLKNAGPVVVDFYAPWCGPCKMIAPLLEQLAGGFSGTLKFAKLNVDDAPEWAGRYGVRGVPTLMLFGAGKVIDQAVGAGALKTLQTWIERAVAAAPQAAVASDT